MYVVSYKDPDTTYIIYNIYIISRETTTFGVIYSYSNIKNGSLKFRNFH